MTDAVQVSNETPAETVLGLRVHPDAALLPLMKGEAFDELVESIRENGLNQKIAIVDGQIVDGRNRARALERLGWEATPHMEEVDLNGMTPAEYAMAANLHRRHLTAKQKREFAGALADRFKAEQATKPKVEKVDAMTKAAEVVGVSRATVARELAKRAGRPRRSGHGRVLEEPIEKPERKAAVDLPPSETANAAADRKVKRTKAAVRNGIATGTTITSTLTSVQRWLLDPATTMTPAQHATALKITEDIAARLEGWQL